MRDLLFRNQTSLDRKKKVISSSEVIDKQGVHTVINRHFICLVKEVKDSLGKKPLPYLYIVKNRNHKEKAEKFFCKIKGSMYVISNGALYLILFMHSLKISLKSVCQATHHV